MIKQLFTMMPTNKIIPIYFRATQPETSEVGAVWVKMANSPTGRIIISYDIPPDLAWEDGDFWLRTFTGTSDIQNLEVDISKGRTRLFASKGTNNWMPYPRETLRVKMKYPNNALFRENGSWVARESYVWDGNQWVKFSEGYNYLYNSGIENVNWVRGRYTVDYLNVLYGEDYIQISSGTGSGYQISVVTEDLFSITGVSKAFIDWENVGNAATSNSGHFVISPSPDLDDGYNSNVAANVSKTGKFERTIDYIDTSSLVGDFRIRVHAKTGSTSGPSTIKFYNVWLEYE